MLYICFFLTATLFAYTLFGFQEERKQLVKRRMAWITDEETESVSEPAEEKTKFAFIRRLISPVIKGVKRSFRRKMTEQKAARIELKLLQAGRPYGMTAVDYRLIQMGLLLTLPVLLGLYAKAVKIGTGGIILFALFGFAAALFLPSYYLNLKAKKRAKLALRELPDVLDLLTVSLEAGLGFDSALSKLVSKADGILPGEFHRCLEEIRLGKTRREALLGLKDRVSLEEVKVLISSILQAEKLGIGMVQVLRVQSHEVREQRKQRAEEAAMKAPIKMLFPLVLFIFPSLFIVLLGPVLIQFMTAFSKE